MITPKAILFDFGNTLLRCERADYVGATAELFGMASNPRGVHLEEFVGWLEEIRGSIDGLRLSTHLEVPITSFQRLLYERFGLSFGLSPVELAWAFFQRAETFSRSPGVKETLEALARRKTPLGVVSNFMLPGEVIRRELAQFGLDEYFRFIMASSEYGVRKPHPAIYKAAAGKLNVEPGEVWFVGDSLEYDVAGPARVGMVPVWYNPGGEAGPGVPVCQIRSLPALVELLGPA